MNYENLKNLLDLIEFPENSTYMRFGSHDDANGTAALRDGEIKVTDPGPLGKAATLIPGANVVLFVNGQLIRDRITVTSKDEIEVYPENTPGERCVSLSISESKLSARLKVTYTPKTVYRLLEADPDNCLTIHAVPASFEAPERYTTNELLEYLRDNGVVYGIDEETVTMLANEAGDAIVARGIPPVPGTDARIELLFPTEVFRAKKKNQNALKLDILDQFDLVQVKPGDVLAKKIPLRPGRPGITVTGEAIVPSKPKDVTLLTGDGAELTPDGLAVVATKAGLPRIKNNYIGVLPFYTHHGDLDPKHGHLSFNGHVVVTGNVYGHVRLVASGDVVVLGSVSDAEVTAGGTLTVKGSVISAILKAGGQDAVLSALVTKLMILAGEIRLLAGAINQVLTNPSFIKSGLDKSATGHLTRLLLDNKFANIPKQFEELLALCREPAYEQIRLIVYACFRRFSGLNTLKFQDPQEIRSIEALLFTKAKALSAEINAPANLNITYAQNSVLQASGKILCIGRGCYDCEVYAGDDVKIIGQEGYFRGKRIIAGGNVDISDLGCPSGQETIVEFSQKAKLRADIVRINTVIKSGRQTMRIDEDQRLLKAWVDYKGKLNVSALRLYTDEQSRWA